MKFSELPPADVSDQFTQWMARLERLPEAGKIAISVLALVIAIYVIVKIVKAVWRVLEWMQRLYWESSPVFKKRAKNLNMFLIGGSVAGLVLAALLKGGVALSRNYGWIAAERIPLAELIVTRASQVATAVLVAAVLMLFFLSWCKSQRAARIEKTLGDGDLVKALDELERLRQEPGQSISVDIRVECLYAYALVLAGKEERALECLSECEGRMRGSQEFQNLAQSFEHQLSYNEEALQLMKLRIAAVLCETGRPADALRLTAEPTRQLAIEIARWNVRGVALGAQGRLDQAALAFQQALRTSLPVAQEEDARVELRSVRRNFAHCLLLQRRPREAGSVLEPALRDLQAQRVAGHPDLVDAQILAARTMAAEGRAADAMRSFDTALDYELKFLSTAAAGMRESDMLRLVRRMHVHFEQYLTVVAELAGGGGPVSLSVALGHVLRRKGLTLRAGALSRRLSVATGTTSRRLQELRRELSEALLSASGGSTSAAYARVQSLDKERQRLEAELAREARPDAVKVLLEDVATEQVRRSIPQAGVLVEFVTCRRDTTRTTEPRGVLHCLAFVLTPDAPEPRFFDLGPEQVIRPLVEQLHRRIERFGAGGTEEAQPPEAQALYQLLIEPIEPSFGNARHLILSLDSVLHYIPFAALIDRRGRLLVERFEMSFVSSGRDLVQVPGSHARVQDEMSFLVGDPTFDARPDGKARQRPREGRRGLGANPLLSPLAASRVQVFAPLPGTRDEVQQIADILTGARSRAPRVLLGTAAAKHELFGLTGPPLLHLATHGFFMPSFTSEDGAGGFQPHTQFGRAEGGALAGLRGLALSPYLGTGLAFCGANTDRGMDGSGLLSGEEVLSLDLSTTDLVVLSACETARGEAFGSQGVQGLHRAFLLAGARNVIASLWKVSDDKTPLLMSAFYRAYVNGQGKSAALRTAMLELLAELERRGESRHPAQWAAFLCFGPPDSLGAGGTVGRGPKPDGGL